MMCWRRSLQTVLQCQSDPSASSMLALSLFGGFPSSLPGEVLLHCMLCQAVPCSQASLLDLQVSGAEGGAVEVVAFVVALVGQEAATEKSFACPGPSFSLLFMYQWTVLAQIVGTSK